MILQDGSQIVRISILPLSEYCVGVDGVRQMGTLRMIRDLEVKSVTGELTTTGDFLGTSLSFPDRDSFIGTPCRWLIFHIKNVNPFASCDSEFMFWVFS